MWLDSTLLRFMNHFDSQAGCDDSIQFIFSVSIEVNDSSVILSRAELEPIQLNS